jgi:hypothetical protein
MRILVERGHLFTQDDHIVAQLAAADRTEERSRGTSRLDFNSQRCCYQNPRPQDLSPTMASQPSGILRWTSSIRDSMINDPGRQFFEDQVQSQGFLFLEEYLDNIWAAAKQE